MNKENRKVLEEATPNSDVTRREGEKYVTLNGERINLGDAYQINAVGESKVRKILPAIVLAICILGMVVAAIAVIRNAYMNQEVSAGITRRESQEVHDGMSKQEVLDWATRTYGANNFIAEVIPHEDSLVTNYIGERVWYNVLDPGVKDIILDTSDTMLVVGPEYLDVAGELIYRHKIESLYEEIGMSVQTIPTPVQPLATDAATGRPISSEPAGEWAGPTD